MNHDHGGHHMPGMGDDMPGMGGGSCRTPMTFTWETQNHCIIFKWWQIRSNLSLIVTLLAVVGLAAGYEAVRAASRRYELSVDKHRDELPHDGNPTETTSFLWPGRSQVEVSKRAHVIKALLYAGQTFYAFMLMLLFMTYNGWIMIAVAVGSFAGYLVFGNNTSATKDNACH